MMESHRLVQDPTHLAGAPCEGCGRPYGMSHLGTCAGAIAMGGPGIVGFALGGESACGCRSGATCARHLFEKDLTLVHVPFGTQPREEG